MKSDVCRGQIDSGVTRTYDYSTLVLQSISASIFHLS